MITRINVPIFFMISGSLLLSKDTSYKDLFFKRILRIAAALLCASFVAYIMLYCRKNFSSFSLIYFFRKLLSGEIVVAYWYLYAYLGFLAALPLLRRIAKQFSHGDFFLIIGIHFFFSTFMPLFNYIITNIGISHVSITSDFSAPLMTIKAFFYPLIGYYIDQVFDINKLHRKHLWLISGIALIGIAISSFFTYHQGIASGYTQDFVQTFDYIIAIAVFLLVKYLFINVKAIRNSNLINKAITLVGSLTFGIYLMDPVLKVVGERFDAIVTTSDPILYSVIWCLFSMTLCGIVTFGLKKIPIVKNIL